MVQPMAAAPVFWLLDPWFWVAVSSMHTVQDGIFGSLPLGLFILKNYSVRISFLPLLCICMCMWYVCSHMCGYTYVYMHVWV